MPRSAIMAGAVDLVLPVAQIPDALLTYDRRMASVRALDGLLPHGATPYWLPGVVDLLRTRTAHDFTLYKPGTLQRRIERRLAMAAIETSDMNRYLELLQRDAGELDLLAKDLLINVTSFFRDPKVFDLLAEQTIPEMVRNQVPGNPIRIWIAGCSTGEETYSLAMLFLEQIELIKRNVRLQVFASDVDPDAIARAREGSYSKTIEEDVSPQRLARFFLKEEHGYRVSPELRATVVFTVQDVLGDPPFSRIDLVSCRNLLIYLSIEAQAKVLSLFHFALREGGLLILGNAETIGPRDDRFAVVSKDQRIYQRTGSNRPGDFGFLRTPGDGMRVVARAGQAPVPSRQAALADLCRRMVMDTYAPAAVLINRKHECLYFLGPTDRCLRVAPGHPTHDLLAIVRQSMRTRLRSALQRASQSNAPVAVVGGSVAGDSGTTLFRIDVKPVVYEGDELLLVCFVHEPKQEKRRGRSAIERDMPRIAELEQELEATRTELQGAIRSLEVSSEEQKAVNEEALSVNEEYQSTNEELLTSKEELQSLNEELTALNSQLQETLERQRTTSNDLQNVLYSTDVATIFLDADLNIRFFTPATKSLFRVIPTDVGRPLADLNSLAADSTLLADAQTVLRNFAPIEREIEAQNRAWYIRRILPYRTQDNAVEGVVITFGEITERRHIANELELAKQQAELANAAKSRFLAAASHDLRQPLQTLALLQGLLARAVEGERAQKLVVRFDETLSAIEGMLNTMLDINQIEAGTVHAEPTTFPVNDLFDRLKDEFTYHAQAKGLALRLVRCSLSIYSDPHLLEQMIRNLVSNALKYTKLGKVLLGCRRHGDMLSIEVCDTGIGIPDKDLQSIFEEYHQLDNAARERSRGLGLGLSIVRRLGTLLGHRVRVRSQPGKGSVFAIEVALPPRPAALQPAPALLATGDRAAEAVRRVGTILVVEDDPEVRELLEIFLKDEGHQAATAPDGTTALDLMARGEVRPDIILADYNLPNGMNGLEVAAKLQENLGRPTPTIVLTGDTSTGALHQIALGSSVRLSKPVKLVELTQVIQRLLAVSPPAAARWPTDSADGLVSPIIFVVDDDSHIRAGLREVLEGSGQVVRDFATCEAFLAAYHSEREACLILDAYLPGMDGIELVRRLRTAGHTLPVIMITGNSDVPMAIRAMKAGAIDFIEKPIHREELLTSVERALEQSRDSSNASARREDAVSRLSGLTARQRQIMEMVLAGHPSKNIAADLGISQRTVENHRASIMKKSGSKSLPALARLAIAASGRGDD